MCLVQVFFPRKRGKWPAPKARVEGGKASDSTALQIALAFQPSASATPLKNAAPCAPRGMLEILIRPKAEQDLIGIWLYTFNQWGEAQADADLDELNCGINSLYQTV